MTRINTNVSSLVSQNTLGRSNASLNQALTRLSTGLRINTGKDDPAGLIASENLRSDITSIRRAISNTDRATQVIATADSALGQVSSLLNDIRGLVTESANSGALSDEQLAANQLQVDSSLEALNRIAQTTTFQGRRLLDGSLDFLTTAGTSFSNITDLKIDQANLGATGSVSVDVSVSAAATQAQVQVTSIPAAGTAAVTASNGTLTFQTAAVAAQQSGTTETGGSSINLANAGSGPAVIDVAAVASGDLDGAAGNITIAFANTATAGSETANLSGSTLTIGIQQGVSTITQVLAAINGFDEGTTGGADLSATLTSGTASDAFAAADIGATGTLAAGADAIDAVDSTITITPSAAGATFNRTITFTDTNDEGAGGFTVTDNGTTLAVSVDDDTAVDLSALATEIENQLDLNDDFSVSFTNTTGDGQYDATVDTAPTLANVGATTAGADATTGGLANDVVIELGGSDGSEVLSFGAGTSIAELVTGINLVSDATGVSAAVDGTVATTLNLTSSAFGTDAFVDLAVIEDDAAIFTDQRDSGTDIAASVNGVAATGNGNELSINTATLDLTATLNSSFTGTASFTITGGGALFQLGPDVVSNQQARLGIGSVNTARLGGVSGKLFQLGTGGSAELAGTDLDTAASIVEEAIDQVTSLRGRLGAFQRTTLETNKNALNDTLVNLTDAESSIRDADFAAESAELTRSQILVQSGTAVLQIANTNPQNVLALLG